MAYQNLTRDERAGDLLEMMLVFAVTTILCIRGFLALTGYPQLGGGNLHIAHMLWGGLGMLVSIAVLLNFWNPAMREGAAAVGGIGFGFFIDELGKFITADNDYFFQPTITILYLIFIVLFLIVGAIRSRPLSAAEISANQRITAAMSDASATNPLARLYTYVDERVQTLYVRVVETRWFVLALSAFFVASAAGDIAAIVALITGRSAGPSPDRDIPLIQQAASIVSSLFIVLGVVFLRRSRPRAYRWFLRSTLVSIFAVQPFVFYYSELAGLGGLAWHLLLYFALRLLIAREKGMSAQEGIT